MCSFRFVTDHSLTLLGTRLTDWLLKKTVYGQFVSGETPDEIVSAVRKLRAVGVGPLLAIPMEDDIDSQHQDADRQFDNNLCSVLDSMNLAYHLQPGGFPMVQLKLTALMPGTLCAMVSKACPEPSSRPEVVEAVARALKGGQPLDVAQIFGSDIPAEMGDQLVKGLQRVAKVCELAVDKQVIVMVDAEYTYMNPALNLITLAMMLNCNTGIPRPPLVFYTYQNYLKATREVLERDVNFLESRGAGFAAKMVRGAYMNKERKSAAMSGLEDPVHDTYDATSAAYDSGVAMLLNKMAASPSGKYRMIVATHNEQSAILAVKRMEKLGIRPDEGSVFFGQLMGMADHITCSLGVNGFLACKSMPYGRVEDTLPYLSRRAQENKAVLEGSRKEHALLTTELRRRFRLGSPIK
ncbi:hypothetical protein BaRGS_00038281 [Batillaria attramentaria]|uniref:Proline dehydrogenase n=1 Tax=Batillaria attramentaria TaxID=370345 RepID=A0ABD0J6J4_9CAEN